MFKVILLGCVVDLDEMVGMVLYLVLDVLIYMIGMIVVVDGGMLV